MILVLTIVLISILIVYTYQVDGYEFWQAIERIVEPIVRDINVCGACNYDEQNIAQSRHGKASPIRQQLTCEDPCEEILRMDPGLKDFIAYVQGLGIPQNTEWRDCDAERLFYRITDGDISARQKLIDLNLIAALRAALLHSKHYDCEIGESVSLAYTGVVVAANKYDPAEHYSFAQL